MASWIAKAVIQRAIGSAPRADALNEWFQRHVTHSLELSPDDVRDRIRNAAEHLARYRTQSGKYPPGRVLDIGTGSFAFLPVVMHLAGAERIVTADVTRLLRTGRFLQTLREIVTAADAGDLDRIVEGVIPERLDAVRRLAQAPAETPIDDLLACLGIRYTVAPDPLAGLPDRSFDLIATSVVLEYFDREALVALFVRTLEIADEGAVHSHEIDLQDQFSYRDASISPVHFLRFSDMAWRLIRSPLTPMSRLRASDIRTAATDAGLTLTAETTDVASPDSLDGLPLASRFQTYDAEDLRTIRLWFTAVESHDLVPA